ncbi:MAG: hypothetical protein K0S53_2936 [Bacteroidetes bacterium]|jgi:hypothetical protein|nr:hypothetical protein [Bacteroidota bacterium]MDF2450735.1 hypothetical protein [Bacteroidota bacterium]
MKGSFFKYLLFFGITWAVLACVKKTSYPTVPEIEYQAFYPYAGDSADIQIKFTDGDGDIGGAESDSTRNFWVTYYYRDSVTNNYTAYYIAQDNDTLRTGYVIKAPSDAYKGKPISGEVNVRLQQLRHSKKIKNIKYVIYLFDAAGNKSNVVTTPEITIP